MPRPGDRVGAVMGGNAKRVEVLGYGVYEGDFVPPFHDIPWGNPRIRLDSGKVAWGCECWWGAEAKMKLQIEAWQKAGAEIVMVEPPEHPEGEGKPVPGSQEILDALVAHANAREEARDKTKHHPECGGDGYLRDGPWGNHVPCPDCQPDED